MADALRAIGRVASRPSARRCACIWSKPRRALRAAQAARCPAATWHDRIDDLPAGPLILLANEFLDALPIRQFVRRGAGWTERHVRGRRLRRGPGRAPRPIPARAEGEVVEIGEAARAVAAGLGRRVAAHAAAPRCSSITARPNRRRATACRRCAAARPPTRWPTRAGPT